MPVDKRTSVRVTDIERTLIDVTVRPTYAGGVEHVLEAYRRARPRVSIPQLLSTLGKLDHVYPYHQAIGFYLERAGYPLRQLTDFKKLKIKFDFYLAHDMRDSAYSDEWRISYPKSLSCTVEGS
jgi:predicted transcriptional regulator of viral defense system